jgi:hypothetical protein
MPKAKIVWGKPKQINYNKQMKVHLSLTFRREIEKIVLKNPIAIRGRGKCTRTWIGKWRNL